jgi:tetratricopeptide (TPR) repeat protein
VFKKIIGFSPQFEAVWIDLSNLYEVQDKTDLAINNYREFVRNFPVKVGIRMRLGELLIRAKRFNEAEKEFQAILEIDSRNRDARQTLGILYLDQGKNDLAIEQFLRLLQDFPADAKTGYLLATAYEEQKSFDDALKEYKRIPAVSSLFTQSQIRIASILQQQGKKDEAQKTIKDAIPNNRDFAPFYSILSVLYEEEKDYKAAEDILREGLLVAKDKIEIRYQLGSLFSKTNRIEDSIREMEAILKENPDHADALNFLGYTYAEKGIKLEDAEKMIKKALQLKPGNGYMLDSLGWVYFKQKRFDEALKSLKEAAVALPNDGAITEHLGDVYLALNLREEALNSYRQAQKSNPGGTTLQEKIDALLKQGLP